ncbi:hypothetical protein MKX08_007869 [Trichoderma sp. CBMAI-0020]|nr:hypothetical protein MKX08_007869 [Trichoderma sp. CBMAI-0020]
MSSHTRKGRQARSNTISLPVICINDDDRVEKAKEAFGSLGPSRDSGRVRKVWQELRQVYEDTVNSNANSGTHRPFPIWARSQFDPRYLEELLRVGYLEDLLRVGDPKGRNPPETGAPSPSLHFKTEPWQFILHFDCIEREKAQAIKEICIKRPKLTFNQLYEEVQKNRLSRIEHEANPKYGFLPCDFKACLKESDNEDGSNAELRHEAEQNRAAYEEGNENGNPENSHPAPVNSNHPNSHESDCTASHDDEDDDLEPLSDILSNTPRRSVPPRVSSLPIMTRDKADETDRDSEVATPIPPTPQAPNVSIRRGLSREQSSSLDPLSDEGIFSSIEEQPFQDRRAVFLDYERLKTSLRTANKSTEICIKQLKEANAAHLGEANQALLNPDAFYEDLQPVLDRISYKMGNNNKKRKSWEDDNEKRKRFAAKVENEAYFENASL